MAFYDFMTEWEVYTHDYKLIVTKIMILTTENLVVLIHDLNTGIPQLAELPEKDLSTKVE